MLMQQGLMTICVTASSIFHFHDRGDTLFSAYDASIFQVPADLEDFEMTTKSAAIKALSLAFLLNIHPLIFTSTSTFNLILLFIATTFQPTSSSLMWFLIYSI